MLQEEENLSAADPQVGLNELVASDSAAVFVPPDNKENLKAGIRPLRVAQVVSFYHPRIGGVETHVQSLAQGCAEAGDDVVVLTHQVGDAPAEEWIGAIRVLRFPMTVPARNYSLSLRLFSYLRRHAADFDIVHVHSYHTVIGHAAVRSRLPFVFTPHYHGTGHTPFRALLHRLYWPAGARLFRAADAVICVSEVERNLVIKDFPGIAGKAVTIPNGTNQKLVTPADDGSSFDDPVVLTVGRLERYKNVDRIIDAFRALPFQATLVVVGDGPDRARLAGTFRRANPGFSARPAVREGQGCRVGQRPRGVRPHPRGGADLRRPGGGFRYPGTCRTRPKGRCRCSCRSRRPAKYQAVHGLARGVPARRPRAGRKSQAAVLGRCGPGHPRPLLPGACARSSALPGRAH